MGKERKLSDEWMKKGEPDQSQDVGYERVENIGSSGMDPAHFVFSLDRV